MLKRLSPDALILAAIILISILGGAVVTYTTVNGPWGYTDPVAYISTARSLDNGQGFGYYNGNAVFAPITFHPPLYPLVLAFPGLFKINLIVAARWINIISFVLSIFLAGWTFFRYSRVHAMGIMASALMCAFPYMVEMFSSAYSEPLFILLFLSSGLSLIAYLRNEKTSTMLASVLLFGMIPFTRYIGIAMVIAAGMSMAIYSSGAIWMRCKKATLFVIFAILPVMLWLVWIHFSTSYGVAGRTLNTNWGELGTQFQTFRGIFLDMVWKWIPFQSHETLLRYMPRVVITAIGLFLIPALSFMAARRLSKELDGKFYITNVQFFTFYGFCSLIFLLVLIISYLFASPTPTLDNRMLLPFFCTLVMTLVGGFALWQAAWFKGKLQVLKVLPWLLALICVIWYIPQTQAQVETFHHGGGYTAFRWDRSGLIKAVRNLPSGQAVISDEWEILLLWTGRPIHDIWETFPTPPPIQINRYGSDPRDSNQALFCQQGAALVILKDFPINFKIEVGEKYLDQLPVLLEGLTVSGTYPEGNIYLCP